MKKRYLKPQETLVYMNQMLPILTGSGREPVNPGDPSIGGGTGGGGDDGEPIEEGGAPGFFDMDDF